jgi:hypothetical protein
VNTLEQRLREAYHSAAEAVRPETIPGPPRLGPARVRVPGPQRQRRLAALAIPLTAAAAVAAVAVAATVVVPRVWPGHGSVTAADQSWNAPPPRYYVMMGYLPHSSASLLYVVNSTTGRIVGQLGTPRHGVYFQAVAALGGDRTFIAAAAVPRGQGYQRHCNTWLYRFRLTASGAPVSLTPFAIPETAGYPESLASNANGRLVAYSTLRCSGQVRANDGQVSVVHLPSRQVTTWRTRWPAVPTSLSLSASGRLLAFVSNPSNGTRVYSPSYESTWVVRTGSPSGPLQRYYRRVTGSRQTHPLPPSWPSATVLSRSGTRLLTTIDDPGGKTALLALRDYRASNGQLIKTVVVLHKHGSTYFAGPGLSPSASGRYVLIYLWNAEVERLDLGTGRVATLPTPKLRLPIGAAW